MARVVQQTVVFTMCLLKEKFEKQQLVFTICLRTVANLDECGITLLDSIGAEI